MASEQEVEKQLMYATKIIERKVDEEIERLDTLNEQDIEAIRKKRIVQMKTKIKKRDEWLANGHGKYYEIPEERNFFDECKKSTNVVCHFYRECTFRCKIVDKHFDTLAHKHIECKFIKLNAEKAPFLCGRLNICIIPTILIVKNEKAVDYIVGFDDLGGHDEYSTEMMEWRIAQSEAIEYSGDLMTPPDMKKEFAGLRTTSINSFRGRRTKKTLRDNANESSDEDDN